MTEYYLGVESREQSMEEQVREYFDELDQADEEARCKCGTLLEGQYNNGEEHDECAICREGRFCDEAYEHGREKGLFRD